MRRLVSNVAAAGVAAALLVPLSAATPAEARSAGEQRTLDRIATPTLVWGACGASAPADFQCATVQVPTDYDRPRASTTTVALTRLPASGPGKRLGSLFFNFGGPGGEGVTSLQTLSGQVASEAVRSRYDLVGFDPRGVGSSDPVTCFASPDQEQAALADDLAFPTDDAETGRFLSEARDLAQACRVRSGDRIRHSSTANVARDMELLRRAVGDARLNYVGYSYGTYLGATYTRLFPQRVGRVVLDGTIDPPSYAGVDRDRRSTGARIGQGPAAAEVFEELLATCAEAGERCALNALGDPDEVVESVWERLRQGPVDVGGTSVSFQDLVVESFFALYHPAQWSGLAEAYAALADPTPTSEQSLPRLLEDARGGDGADYASVGGSLASLCVDSPSFLATRGYPAQAAREERRAGPWGAFARFRSWVGVHCGLMGLSDDDAFRGPWKQSTRATVLVIGTRFDPATPYANTRAFTDRYRDGRMLTVEGYGHTIIGLSTCADDVVTRHLVDGAPPRDGARCAQDVTPFESSTPQPRSRQDGAPTRVPGVPLVPGLLG